MKILRAHWLFGFTVTLLPLSAFGVEVLGVSSAPVRGNDLIGMATACHAQFGPGTRVCQSEDMMRATSIVGLPDYGSNSVPVILYAQPSIKGGASAANGAGARSIDATGAAEGSATSPQCVVVQRFINLQAEPVNTFDLTATCGTPRQVICCLD